MQADDWKKKKKHLLRSALTKSTEKTCQKRKALLQVKRTQNNKCLKPDWNSQSNPVEPEQPHVDVQFNQNHYP